MAGRIPSAFIDDLLNRVDIVDVIDRRLPLKKAGKEYQACCPFHSEKTPSFTVSSEKQFYHCFGCGAHGSAIGFLMEYENLGFIEAVEELADIAGIEVPREEGFQKGPDLRPLHAILERAATYYRRQLREHPLAENAVNYLKNRGLSGEIAANFGIGYAPSGWDNLLTHLGTDQTAISQLKETGLIIEQDGKRYDRFRNRIMFPIRDQRGHTIGFGGRVLRSEDNPKYLNSPETPVFHKGLELYGFFEARKSLRKINRLLVVEGYMDVVALAQFGLRNVVATLGTATSREHLERMFRTCPDIIFCFDGDRAGRDAAWKALQTALPIMREGREAHFLFLPEGEDPDTLIRQEGAQTFDQRMNDALPLSQFLFDHLSAKVQMHSIDGRAHLAELAKPLLEKLPAGVFRQMMFQHLETLIGLKSGSLENPVQQDRKSGKSPIIQGSEFQKQRPTPIRMAIALLLDNPSLISVVNTMDNQWLEWEAPGIPILKRLLDLIHNQPTLNKATLLERWRDTPEFTHLNKLANYRFDIPGMDQESELRDALQKINQQYLKQRISIPGNLKPSELSEDEIATLKQRYPGYREQDNELS